MEKICLYCKYRKSAKYSRDDISGSYFCYNHNSPVNKGSTTGVSECSYERPACEHFSFKD